MSRRAAAPGYLPDAFEDCPPGHRFSLYARLWDMQWGLAQGAKEEALEDCARPWPRSALALADALRQRQRVLLGASDGALVLPARSTAPFVTGLGQEHPVENGFAFLTPYGLPYLPGSSVKGVVRRAWEELMLEDAEGFDLATLWWLFGLDAEGGLLNSLEAGEGAAQIDRAAQTPVFGRLADHLFAGSGPGMASATERLSAELADREQRRQLHFRGRLTFHDVFPRPRGDGRLKVDILTPHYTHYYRDGDPPHDAGQPNPVPFLVIGAGAAFDFAVTCTEESLPVPVRRQWRALVQQAFAHAFDWVGFGAKGALGYGQMLLDTSSLDDLEDARVTKRKQEALERELSGLPDDVAWLKRRQDEGCFAANDRLLETLEPWLREQTALSDEALQMLKALLDRTWKDLLRDPEATTGKKKRPRFNARPRALAHRLLDLGIDPS